MSDQDTDTDTAAAETSGDNGTTADSATEAATETETTTDGDGLGDAGKQAIDRMKADRNKAREEARKIKAEFDAFKAKAEGKEAEHQAELESQRIRDEALAKANDRILRAEVRAHAAGKLADPKDALRFIDLSEFEVDSDGEVHGDIAAALDDLISKKPYLAAQGGTRFQGNGDGGTRKESGPAQLTEDDVKRLYAEGKHEEIVKAEAEGRLANVLGRK